MEQIDRIRLNRVSTTVQVTGKASQREYEGLVYKLTPEYDYEIWDGEELLESGKYVKRKSQTGKLDDNQEAMRDLEFFITGK